MKFDNMRNNSFRGLAMYFGDSLLFTEEAWVQPQTA